MADAEDVHTNVSGTGPHREPADRYAGAMQRNRQKGRAADMQVDGPERVQLWQQVEDLGLDKCGWVEDVCGLRLLH